MLARCEGRKHPDMCPTVSTGLPSAKEKADKSHVRANLRARAKEGRRGGKPAGPPWSDIQIEMRIMGLIKMSTLG